MLADVVYLRNIECCHVSNLCCKNSAAVMLKSSQTFIFPVLLLRAFSEVGVVWFPNCLFSHIRLDRFADIVTI